MAEICAVDIFCGVGGLSRGLADAGIRVVAGIDLDPACEYPFESNIGAEFMMRDAAEVSGTSLRRRYPAGAIRLLAGCAPCQPFSSHRKGRNTAGEAGWKLLREFSRIASELIPDLVTMENVARLVNKRIFADFVRDLRALQYAVDWRIVNCARLGVPQERKRLVLIASRIGAVAVPTGQLRPEQFRTVRQTIANLPSLVAGETHPRDPLHRARALNGDNFARIRAAKAGGFWRDWPIDLRAPCHRRRTGRTFRSVYARMSWDKPAPTITTQAYNFGTGRFGHPEQDRAISLREAAMLQTFPRNYEFFPPGAGMPTNTLGRLIGNAVPPMLGYHIGRVMLEAIGSRAKSRR